MHLGFHDRVLTFISHLPRGAGFITRLRQINGCRRGVVFANNISRNSSAPIALMMEMKYGFAIVILVEIGLQNMSRMSIET